jgi:hypothetical protein
VLPEAASSPVDHDCGLGPLLAHSWVRSIQERDAALRFSLAVGPGRAFPFLAQLRCRVAHLQASMVR